VKAAQLDISESTRAPTEDEISAALAAYKFALEDELSLRTIIPGVRIVAPNDPKRQEKDIAAAKQFLGLDLEADELVPEERTASIFDGNDEIVRVKQKSKNELLLQSRRRFDGESGSRKSRAIDEGGGSGELGNGAKATLIAIAVTQIALLVVLSFDPMTADNVFTAIGGNPPDSLPSGR